MKTIQTTFNLKNSIPRKLELFSVAIRLYISLVAMLITLCLASLFLAFGPCYNDCSWETYLYSSRFLLPFAVTVIVQFMIILHWHKTGSMKKWHMVIVGLSGFIFIALSLYAILIDFGDAIIYATFLILGFLISQPATFLRKSF